MFVFVPSCSIVLAYLVKHRTISLLDALLDAFVLVKEQRSIVYPNPSFILRLIEFEREVTGACTVPMEALALHRSSAPSPFMPRLA